ncbi:MAG: HEAT repeat domain-containing protein [Candidatus Heimdallarchaeota archaeon]|nr:HEAT repeat domain-containing protein [Candidatus Heimdallarchaeota archaeon]
MNIRDFEEACKNYDVPKLIEALNHRRSDIQEKAILYLGKSGDERAVSPLIEKIGEGKTSENCIKALGEIGGKDAVKYLLDLFNKGNKGQILAESLGKIGDSKAVLQILDFFKGKNHHDYAYYDHLFTSLGQIGDKRAIPLLTKVVNIWLKNPTIGNYGCLATEALCNIGEEESIELILDFTLRYTYGDEFDDYSYSENIAKLRDAIVSLGCKVADPIVKKYQALPSHLQHVSVAAYVISLLERLDCSESVKGLTWILQNEYSEIIKQETLKSLGKLGRVEAIPILMEIMKNEKQTLNIYAYAAESLAKVGSEEALDFLLTQLENPLNKERHIATAYALSIHKEAKSIIPLIEALQNQYIQDWWISAGIVNLGDNVIDNLLDLLEEKDDDLKERIIMILGEIGSPKALSKLSSLVKEGNEHLSYLAFITLGKLGDLKSINEIITYFESNPKKSKWDVVGVVSEFFEGILVDSDSIPELLSFISMDFNDDEVNDWIKFKIAEKIKGLDVNPEHYNLFLNYTNDSDMHIQEVVVDILRKYDSNEALDALIDYAKEDSHRIVKQAIEALTYKADERTIPFLISKITSNYSGIPEAAIEALNQFEDVNIVEKLIEYINSEHSSAYLIACIRKYAEKFREDVAIEFLSHLILTDRHIDQRGNAFLKLKKEFREKIGEVQFKKIEDIWEKARETYLTEKEAKITESELRTLIKNQDIDRILEGIKKRQIDFNDGCTALSEFKDEKSIKRLFKEVREGVPTSNEAASFVLRDNMVEEVPIKFFLEVLKDANQRIKYVATQALEKLYPKNAGVEIIDVLIDNLPDTRYILEETDDKNATRQLLPLLKHKNHDVRESIVTALKKIIEEENIPELVKLLKKGDEDTKLRALDVVHYTEFQSMIPVFLELSNSKREQIKKKIVSIFTVYGFVFKDKKIVKRLLEMLYDQYQSVRENALYALQRIGDPITIRPLTQIIQSSEKSNKILPNPEKHYKFIDALKNLGDEIIPHLLEFINPQKEFWASKHSARLLSKFETPEVRRGLENLALNGISLDSRKEALRSLTKMASDISEILKGIVFNKEEYDEMRLFAASELRNRGLEAILISLETELDEIERNKEEEYWDDDNSIDDW